MKPSYDSIYLSPHLDDAVLSCGGQIYEQTQQGKTALVVTIAAGKPQSETLSIFAQFLHHNWGLSAAEAVTMRRAEDLAACALLGAEALHWSLPDCIYRLHPETEAPLYTSNEAIFGAVHEAEEAPLGDIAGFLASLPAAQTVFAPLGAGNHVDHQLTRLAAEQVWGAALTYYEDYPYVQRDLRAVARLTRPAAHWRSHLTPLSAAALATRIEAIDAYRSQIRTLFNSRDEMAAAVATFVAQTGGERVWRRTAAAGGAHKE